MRTAIDDLPSISASRMRAAGLIRPNETTATVAFPDAPTFVVALQHIRFPNRGGWSFFVCPCGRRCRTLRLYDGSLGCKGWARRTKSLDVLLPALYLRGASTGDFQEVLTALLGKEAPNLSPSVIGRLKSDWEDDYRRWQARDLSARRYVYVWADGVYLQARMEPQAECMLVLIGATPEGRKELLGLQTGMRESGQSWKELLVDLKARGLSIAPDIAVGDGALGFWKALEEAFPSTRHQRCWQHKSSDSGVFGGEGSSIPG